MQTVNNEKFGKWKTLINKRHKHYIQKLEIQTLKFSSEQDFVSWKEKEEEATFTHYIKTTDGKLTKAKDEEDSKSCY